MYNIDEYIDSLTERVIIKTGNKLIDWTKAEFVIALEEILTNDGVPFHLIDELVLCLQEEEKKPQWIPGPATDAGTSRVYSVDSKGELHLTKKDYAEEEHYSPATQNDIKTKKPKDGARSTKKPSKSNKELNKKLSDSRQVYKPQSVLKRNGKDVTKQINSDNRNIEVYEHYFPPAVKAAQTCLEDINNNLKSASQETQKVWGDYYKSSMNSLSKIQKARENLSKEETERIIEAERTKLAQAFTDLFEKSGEFNEYEGREVLKNYGEVAVYIDLLAQGKEAYLPQDPTFPIADIVIVNRNDESDIIALESISVKSKGKKTSVVGAATSNKEILKQFKESIKNKDSKLVKEVDEYLDILAVNSIDKVKIKKLSKKTKKIIEAINKAETVEDLSFLFNDDDKKEIVEKVKKKLEKCKKCADTSENRARILREISYRKYKYLRQLELLNQRGDAKIGYKYANILATRDGIKTEIDEEEHTYDSFEISEKSSLKVTAVDDKGNITSASYSKGENGLRPKRNKE